MMEEIKNILSKRFTFLQCNIIALIILCLPNTVYATESSEERQRKGVIYLYDHNPLQTKSSDHRCFINIYMKISREFSKEFKIILSRGKNIQLSDSRGEYKLYVYCQERADHAFFHIDAYRIDINPMNKILSSTYVEMPIRTNEDTEKMIYDLSNKMRNLSN